MAAIIVATSTAVSVGEGKGGSSVVARVTKGGGGTRKTYCCSYESSFLFCPLDVVGNLVVTVTCKICKKYFLAFGFRGGAWGVDGTWCCLLPRDSGSPF